jgi:23S rRNA pseudouridine2605 synthase
MNPGRKFNEKKSPNHNSRMQKADKTKKEPDVIGADMRLNRYIALSGVCSRREADELIKSGQISINNIVVTEFGQKVSSGDVVKFNGKVIIPEKPIYILLNKPKNCVTTLSDPHAKFTVLDIIKNACSERVFPVGRLDRNTTGVLLLTNDGELADQLTHPSYNKMKIYQVNLDKPLDSEHMKLILQGLELEDGFIKADDISYVSQNDKSLVGIEIHSGRNRIVRRIFEFLSYRVERLDRVYFAGLTKKGLQRGQWRFLTDKEISLLKKGNYE